MQRDEGLLLFDTGVGADPAHYRPHRRPPPAGGYTIDELVDFPGATYKEITGEAGTIPAQRLMPATPTIAYRLTQTP
ncbi:hypothetical protein ACFWJQ_11400 [Streptomyces goshikiensis]|uniref:hypothetical protein n=1 Tax=Streptomyces goshikiensis TaxID=1942 RepID=UPI00365C4CFB